MIFLQKISLKNKEVLIFFNLLINLNANKMINILIKILARKIFLLKNIIKMSWIKKLYKKIIIITLIILSVKLIVPIKCDIKLNQKLYFI